MSSAPRLIEVRAKVLKQNDLLARQLREQFRRSGVFVVSMVSSPGSGKTAFLETLLRRLSETHRVAALVGDLATENDAARLCRAAPQVKQITTGTICHLDAQMVQRALEEWQFDELDFLFIENVGNLVCPSSYDLGEELRMVMLSTTEGEDKPLKYPTIFNGADVAVITKMDLAAAAEFNLDTARGNIENVRPGMRVLEVSSKTGHGVDETISFLHAQLEAYRSRFCAATISIE
jgi:hydrogenase nickel incorporation protein HypB